MRFIGREAKNYLVLVFAMVLGVAVADARGVESAGPETFLRRLYAPYIAGDAHFDPTGKHAPMIFSPRLVRLIRLDAARAHGEGGLLDADPVCDCQDIDNFQLRSLQRLPSRTADVVVRVRIANGGRIEGLTYRLVKVRSGWRVADIASEDIPSLLAFLDTGSLRCVSGHDRIEISIPADIDKRIGSLAVVHGLRWVTLVDEERHFVLFKRGMRRLALRPSRQMGVWFQTDGTQKRVKVFTRPGVYRILFSDNLETEPDNMAEVSCLVRVR